MREVPPSPNNNNNRNDDSNNIEIFCNLENIKLDEYAHHIPSVLAVEGREMG